MPRPYVVTPLVLIAALGVADRARAQPARPDPQAAAPPRAPTEGRGLAELLQARGDQLMREQRFGAALRACENGFAAFPSPNLFVSMGSARVTQARLAPPNLQLGLLADAARDYQRFLDSDPRDVTLDASVNAQLQELTRVLGRILVVVPAGAAAELRVDDGEWQPAPTVVWVAPGAFALDVRRAGGGQGQRHPGAVDAGKVEHLQVGLVELVGAGEEPALDAGVTAVLEVPAAAPPTFWSRHRGSVGLGAGAVGVGALGLGLGIWTRHDYVELVHDCAYTNVGCSAARIDAVEREALATNVTLGIAGAAAAGAVVLYLLESRHRDGEGRSPALVLVPAAAGAVVQGRF